MQTISRISRSVLVLLAVAATWPTLASASDARQGIDAGNARVSAALAAKDATSIAAVYAEDGVLYPPGGAAVSGRKAIAEAWVPMLGVPLTFKTSEVKQSGDLAVETGTWTLAGPDGKPGDHGAYLVTWKRAGKRWQVWREIWNSSKPPAKP